MPSEAIGLLEYSSLLLLVLVWLHAFVHDAYIRAAARVHVGGTTHNRTQKE